MTPLCPQRYSYQSRNLQDKKIAHSLLFHTNPDTINSMKILPKSEYPKDFFYHRTSAEIYRPYIESCGNITTFDIGNNPQYAWKK